MLYLNKIIKVFILNIVIFLCGIFIIEIIFGSWFYSNSNFKSLLIPKQQSSLLDKLPYYSSTTGIYTRDKYGFRANTYQLDNIDILILGGSTTEEREVDDKKIWTKIFEKNLDPKLKVLNAGIGGQTSFGHKSMFNLWFSKLEDLKPTFILFYIGINDSLFLIENINIDELPVNGRIINSSNRDLLINEHISVQILQYIKNNSVFHTLYLLIKGNIISKKYNISYNNKTSQFNAFIKNKPNNLDKLNNKMISRFKKNYINNLKELLNFSSFYGAEVIFVTQKVSNLHWLYKYLSIVNDITKDFCKQNKIKCFDLAYELNNIDNNSFYDGIHTTPSGSKLIGEFIALKFNNYLK